MPSPINLNAVWKNAQIPRKTLVNIASKSFNDLTKKYQEFLSKNHDNIKNVEIRIKVKNVDEDKQENEEKRYLLSYEKQEKTPQYKLVSIYDIDDEKKETIIKIFEENKEPFGFIMFDYIIGIYVDKYSEKEYGVKSANIALYEIYLDEDIKINMKEQQQEEQEQQEEQQQKQQQEPEPEAQEGGKLKVKGQKKKTSKKPVVSQSKENKYKEVLGKRMKIYKKPDSRKEFVRYKGELVSLVEYKKSKKEMAKSKNAKK